MSENVQAAAQLCANNIILKRMFTITAFSNHNNDASRRRLARCIMDAHSPTRCSVQWSICRPLIGVSANKPCSVRHQWPRRSSEARRKLTVQVDELVNTSSHVYRWETI